MDDGLECTLKKFTHGTKPGRVVDTPESEAALQRDLDMSVK